MAMNDLKNKIAIVGVGYTPQGKIEGRTAGLDFIAKQFAMRSKTLE